MSVVALATEKDSTFGLVQSIINLINRDTGRERKEKERRKARKRRWQTEPACEEKTQQ